MEPISGILITIGFKSIGVGKVVTAVKLAIAGKKLTAVAVAAKNALVHQTLIESLNPGYDPDVFGDEPRSTYSHQISNPPIIPPQINDQAFLKYLGDRFQSYSIYETTFDPYTSINYDQIKKAHLEQIIDSEVLDKVKEVYGDNAYISSVATEVEGSAKGLLLPTDFDNWDQLERSAYLSKAELNPYTAFWEDISQYENSDMVNNYISYQDLPPSKITFDLSSDLQASSNVTDIGSIASIQSSAASSTMNEILANEDLSDLEQDRLIGKQVATKFEALNKDPSYQQRVTPLQSEISHQLDQYFKTNTIHFKGNDKLLKLVSHHKNWKDLPAQLAELAEEIYPNTTVEEMSLSKTSELMGFFFSVNIYKEKGGLMKMINEKSKEIEELKQKIEIYYTQKENEENVASETIEEISIPKDELFTLLEEGDTEEVIELLLKYLPEDHPLRDEAVLLSNRMKVLEEKFLSGLLTDELQRKERNEITEDLIKTLRRLYS